MLASLIIFLKQNQRAIFKYKSLFTFLKLQLDFIMNRMCITPRCTHDRFAER